MTGIGGATASGQLGMMELWQKTIELNKLKQQERLGVATDMAKRTSLESEIRAGRVECSTCASRKYVDRSDDPSVSFQTPTNISPAQSAGAVLGHEREHVVNEAARARKENREVIHSSVTIQYSTCPECGSRYAAGGQTKTVTRGNSEQGERSFRTEGERGMLLDKRA